MDDSLDRIAEIMYLGAFAANTLHWLFLRPVYRSRFLVLPSGNLVWPFCALILVQLFLGFLSMIGWCSSELAALFGPTVLCPMLVMSIVLRHANRPAARRG